MDKPLDADGKTHFTCTLRGEAAAASTTLSVCGRLGRRVYI